MPGLLRRPFLFGPLYGISVYLVMNYVVIPLSAVPGRGGSPAPVVWITGVLAHMFLIGLPIALAARTQLSGAGMTKAVRLVFAWALGVSGICFAAAVPVWLIGGEKDELAPAAEARALAQEIERAGGTPRLTILPGRDHGILDVSDRPDVSPWLLAHTSPSPKPR